MDPYRILEIDADRTVVSLLGEGDDTLPEELPGAVVALGAVPT